MISVLVVALPLTLGAGCYASHEVEPRDGSDGGVDGSSPGASDATIPRPSRPDAVVLDGGPLLDCPLVSADVTCNFALVARVPQTLSVTFDTCACCAPSQCTATVDHAAHRIALTTVLCDDACDCDACNTPTIDCALPALEEGTWDVAINDSAAFRIPFFVDPIEASLPTCITRAEVDHCAPRPFFEVLRPWSAGALCAEESPSSSTLSHIEVTGDCVQCGEVPGPCAVGVSERLTDDLPPGADLFIDLTGFPTECDVDCPEVCSHQTRQCVVPPLTPGDFYRVFAGDELIGSFVAGSGVRGCAFDAPGP